MPADVKNLHKYHKTKRTLPSFDEIVKVLYFTLRLYSRAFIIIDALDECHVSNEGRNRFLLEVFSFQVQAQINVFATSRFVLEIMLRFEGYISKEIRA